MTHSRLRSIVQEALQNNQEMLMFELPHRKFREGKPIRLFGRKGGPLAHVVGETADRLQVRVHCMDLLTWLDDNRGFMVSQTAIGG